MSDVTANKDAIDVEQIMRQIRARVREKHGAEYTEKELQQLASAKLDTFLDPKGTRAALVAEFKRRATAESVTDFSEAALYDSHRGWLKSVRRLLNPILKLLINPIAFSRAMQARHEIDGLTYEVVRHLVVELTRLNLEVHNLKMKVESLSTRVDFDERRTKAFAGVAPSRPVAQERPRHQPQQQPQPQQGRGPGGFQGRQGPGGSAGSTGAGSAGSTGSTGSSGSAGSAGSVVPTVSVNPPAVPFSPAPSMAPTGTFAVPGGSSGTPSEGAGNIGGEPRRRRRRRRRRRPGGQGPQGQGPQGQGPQGQGPQGQGPQGQGPQGSAGSTGSSGSAGSQTPHDSHGSASPGSSTEDAGGDWEDADEGASDQ